LQPAFSDPVPDVRAAAAAVLAELLRRKGQSSAPAELVGFMADPSPTVRASTVQAIALLGGNVPQQVVAGLDDESPAVRGAVAHALKSFGRIDAAIPRLLALLERDEALREPYLRALEAARPSSAVVPALAEALKSGSRLARLHAAILLGRVGPDAKTAVPGLIALLKEPAEPEVMRQTIGTSFMLENTAGVGDPSCAAMIALRKIDTTVPVIAALAEELSSDISLRRIVAARVLGEIGPPAALAIPALVSDIARQLGTKEWDSELYVPETIALGRIAPGTPQTAEAVAILSRALDCPDHRSAHAAEALASFGKEGAITLDKLRALRNRSSDDPYARDAAQRAITAIEPAQSRPKEE
ncbi:MAG TPA: HEAT repeat domain-containing protein, partial [Isosphaeraceae bacterium]|nr:HEAT repeat domain-containing protein [Isosphaeraceae bacterium]